QPMKNRLPLLATARLMSALPSLVSAQDATREPDVTVPAPAVNPWRIDASATYSRGEYGLTEDTEVYVGLLNIVYETKSWRFQTGVPVLHIEGPATIVGGGAGVATQPADSSETGLGDVTVSGTYKFGPLTRAAIDTDFTAQVKLPTANEDRGLGTGKVDTYLQFDARKTFGRVTPFATLGYRFLGSDSTYPLKDGIFASLGVAAPVTTSTTAGVAVSWREKIVDDQDDSVDAMLFAQTVLTEHWRVLAYGLAGFTESAPDFGFGAGVTYKF
ncbi:MAG: transporter, partial [Rariglobus sp.]